MEKTIPREIKGTRIILRAKTTDCAEELYQLIEKNRLHLRPWMPWEEDTKSVVDYRQIQN